MFTKNTTRPSYEYALWLPVRDTMRILSSLLRKGHRLLQRNEECDASRRAHTCSLDRPQIVAFTTRGNRICGIGFNSYRKTHPQQARFARLAGNSKKEYLHAEVAALLRSPHDVDTIYVMRFDKQGNPVCAKPCAVCETAISILNPDLRVIHT